MRIYLAGPLFTPYERDFLDSIAARLRAEGMEVFVPHEQAFPEDALTPSGVFATDCRGLLPANAVVALLDGTVVDDGTACEIGIFFGMRHAGDDTKKGVIGLVTDSRVLRGSQGLNLFVQGCIEGIGTVVTTVDEVVDQLQRWRAELA